MKPISTADDAQAAALRVEWLKIRRYRTFWIIAGLFAATAAFGIYVYNNVLTSDPKLAMVLSSGSTFSSVWYDVAYMTSQFIIFLALLVVLLTGNEYQFRTHRQNVIDGWTRLRFLHAKWALVGVLALAVVAFAVLEGVIIGAVRGSSFSSIYYGTENLLWLALQTLVYAGGALLLVTLIRRSGLALIILLGYYLMVDNLLHSLFKYRLNAPALDYLLPFETADQLTPIPHIGKAVEEFVKYEQMPVWSYAVASVVWIAIFYAISRWRTLRTDW